MEPATSMPYPKQSRDGVAKQFKIWPMQAEETKDMKKGQVQANKTSEQVSCV